MNRSARYKRRVLDALAKPTMPTVISTPDTAMAESTPSPRGAGASNASIPNTKLATGLVTLIAATAGGNGPLANAICTYNIPLTAVTANA
jgi:hypothetical protein